MLEYLEQNATTILVTLIIGWTAVYCVAWLYVEIAHWVLDLRAKRASVITVENTIYADANGALPIARQLIESGAVSTEALALLAQLAENKKPLQPVPNVLHVSNYTHDRRELALTGGSPFGVTGGGQFSLLNPATDERHTALPSAPAESEGRSDASE